MINNRREKPTAVLFSYLCNAFKILFYIPQHIQLSKVLKPFSSLGLIANRTYYVYLSRYLSYALSTEMRLDILINHYKYFKKNFPYHILRSIFKDGLVCWSETRGSDNFEIRLVDAYPYETEGSLSFVFNVNGTPLYTVSFTFSPGNHFGLVEDQVLYVTRIQGAKESLDIISGATKTFSDNTPPVLLISAIEGMALSLGIRTIVGISLHNQIGYALVGQSGFQKNYDEFWKTYESVKISNSDYLLSLPIAYKGLSLIKSKHRSRVLAKRKVREGISRKVYSFFMNNVLTGKRVRFSPLRVVRESKATA